jgi:hypothetical protein
MKNPINDLSCMEVYCANASDWDCQEISDFDLLKSNDFVCFEDFQFFDLGFNPENSMISWLSMQQKECSYCKSDISRSIDGPNENTFSKSYSIPPQQSYSSDNSETLSGVSKPAESESNQKTNQISSESQSEDDLNANSTQSVAESKEKQTAVKDPFLPDPTNDNINQNSNGFLPSEISLLIFLFI